ncbi:MAG: GNAT family N-acetyltransferase [Pyrinomonadaceae bacterium]
MSSFPAQNELSITAERPDERDSMLLLARLREELAQKYPDELRGVSPAPDDFMKAGAIFVVARQNGKALGCGAIRPLEPGVAEVKRMFVAPEARGRGIGRAVLEKLETLARELGYCAIRLETGLKQPEAIALYEAAGFKPYPCYGPYATNPLSVCFEKQLRATVSSFEFPVPGSG